MWIQPAATCCRERADRHPESSVILLRKHLPTGTEPEEEKGERAAAHGSACQKGTSPCMRPPVLLQPGGPAG